MNSEFVSGLPDPKVRPARTLADAVADAYRSMAEKRRVDEIKAARRAAFLAAEKQEDDDEAAETWYSKRHQLEFEFAFEDSAKDGTIP